MEKITKRYHFIDTLRGITLVSMILYHLIWSMVYLWSVDLPWYQSAGAYFWQQTICWSFIFISGFSWCLGSKPFRRGLLVFLAGVAVTVVTTLIMPEERIHFGILTLLGSSMLLTCLLRQFLEKIPPLVGLIFSSLLFLVTRNINNRELGFEGLSLWELPDILYQNNVTAFLGFPHGNFYSADYFSLFPWFFLFLAGYFTFAAMTCPREEKRLPTFFQKGVPPLAFLGRHSLLIYLLHQPVILLILYLLWG